MIICKNEESSKKVCCMTSRSCAGNRCMAWSDFGDGGLCGMVTGHASLTLKTEVKEPSNEHEISLSSINTDIENTSCIAGIKAVELPPIDIDVKRRGRPAKNL